ncbi:hypothetical protein [Candidatus Methylomicrobium oryzae]|jgi:hypothetical protein|uniref:hypothetical protein n=1 Tax=Candidatus Methylomicrobium oryzae TaxID=2802053 RepID=UPI001924CF71|nr:hypothetical protein [Methylomicrobium sp. RS1]MBL1262937.1 hypothetical protein [Methylomicrobium sp. RS1]
MKKIRSLVLLLSMATAMPGFAQTPQPIESDGYDVFLDAVFLKPIGIAGTLVGAGLFVGLSPLTALANIPSPHDAFEKLGNTIVCKPFKWTFERPVGDYEYNGDCTRRLPEPMPVVQHYEPKPAAVPPPAEPPRPNVNKQLDAIFKREMMK